MQLYFQGYMTSALHCFFFGGGVGRRRNPNTYYYSVSPAETKWLSCKILQESCKKWLSCKILQDEWLSCKILQDERLSCKILAKNQRPQTMIKQIDEINHVCLKCRWIDFLSKLMCFWRDNITFFTDKIGTCQKSQMVTFLDLPILVKLIL